MNSLTENMADFARKLKKRKGNKQGRNSESRRSEIRQIINKKVEELLEKAEACQKEGSPKKSREFVKKARRLAMKFRVRLSSKFKKTFCKHCFSFFVPGKNCRIRIAKRRVIYYCLECKKFMRFSYLNEKKQKKSINKLN